MIIIKSLIGKVIATLRRQKGFKTTKEFALAADVAPVTLQRIERGLQMPTPATLTKIAASLNLTAGELLRQAGYLKGSRSFGQTLRGLRHNMGLTQQQLAEKLNLSRNTYVHYELDRRQPDCSTLQLFADFFQVNVDFLLGRTDEDKPISQINEQMPNSSQGLRSSKHTNKNLGLLLEQASKLSDDTVTQMIEVLQAIDKLSNS